MTIALNVKGKPAIGGEILTSADIRDHNGFGSPEKVRPGEFKDFKVKDGILTVRMPAKSIISLSVKP